MCVHTWNKKNVCPHDDGVQSKTNFVPHIAQPIVRITRNNRRTPTKNQTACRNHQQKKTKTELKKSCTTHRTLVNAKRQLSAVTPMKCSVEYRSTAQVGKIQAPHCQSRCTRVAQKTNMSFQRFDRFHHGANNKHNVCRSSNVHRRHQPTTHTMTKQKQDKSHGNQGNYHNDVELQTWCTHVLATVNRNICSKLCDLHIMLF